MIIVTFLGTGAQIPTNKRNHTSILLVNDGENILIDCGEGTQRQFKKAGLNYCKLTRILVTHIHGDHVLGLVGLLQSMSLNEYNKELLIYGPKGIKDFMQGLGKMYNLNLKFKIKVEEVAGKFFENGDFCLEAEKMAHGVPCNAYSFVKKGQIRINKEKLKKMKDISIENLKKLKQGKNIIHKGKKYSAKIMTVKEENKKISFVLDTLDNKNIVPFVKDSDLLICESSYDSKLSGMAREHMHLTAEQAGKIAKKGKVGKLILTHISQRYEKNLKDFLKDAKKEFKDTSIAGDFDVVKV